MHDLIGKRFTKNSFYCVLCIILCITLSCGKTQQSERLDNLLTTNHSPVDLPEKPTLIVNTIVTSTQAISKIKSSTPIVTKTIQPNIQTKAITPTSPVPKKVIIDESFSPDRRWIATVIRSHENGEVRVIFKVELDYDGVIWIVEDVPYEDVPAHYFLFPVPFYWSKDGRYLFYTHAGSGDGCFGGGNHEGWDLFKLDLTTGETVQVLPNGGSWISLSPDEVYFAYFFYTKQGITLLNMNSGDINSLDLMVRQEDVGWEIDQRYIVWSPDSKRLVYVVMAGVCDYTVESYFNWLVLVDVQNLTQKVILGKDERGLVPINWIEENKILFRDSNHQLWLMDLETKELYPLK